MIILSGVLVVLAIALLVTGIVTGNTGHEVAGLDGLKLIYVSIGVSVISALCLAIGVFLRRKELFGSTESETSTRSSAASRSGKATRPAKAKARVGAGDDASSVPMPSTTATYVPAETSVYIVPGRKRYHLETCRQLAGRDKEELTFVEAREEGFTACTACLPDTALAARAATTDTEYIEIPPTEPVASEDLADTADLTRREDDDPAMVTRTDLPVTRLDDDDLAPAAESPAAAESSTSTETSTSGAGTDATTDTTRFDEVAETPETASEPPVERPSARGRSLFEPLDQDDPSAAAEDTTTTEDATAEETSDVAEPEPSEPEPSEPEPSEPEPSEPEPSEPEDITSAAPHDAEPAQQEPEDVEPSEHEAELPAPSDSTETVEADEAPAVETDRDTGGSERTAEALSADAEAPADATLDHEGADDEGADDEGADDEGADDEGADHEGSDHGDAGHEDAADDAASTHDAASTQDAAGHPDLPFVRILSGTKRYHRPDCALIEDIADDADDLETLSPAEAKERGCTPCLVCQPDKDPSDDGY